ncbi:MAG TPA: radical SAM protein [Blastocatellia bacterium]|jgi:Fe-S oxidoreductase
MKITLINCGVKTSKEHDGARAPQGCLYLIAAAREAGFEITFRDYQTQKLEDPLNTAVFAKFLEDDSDIVAISCMSNLLPLVLRATEIFKRQYPEKKIILGGIGPSGVAEKLMPNFRHIDVIAKGEGEETFADILRALDQNRPLTTVDGLLVRMPDSSYVATPPRKRRRDLDQFPFPAYDAVDMSRYETVGIQTARGCPFPCTFCDVSAYWGRTSTYRSISPVMDEMAILEGFGFDKVTILDDTFILKRQRVNEFCDAYRARGLNIEWSAYCRVDLLTDEMVDTFAASGCYRVFLGIESGSNRVLQRISKPLDHEHLVRMVRRMSKSFIVRANLIWGFPFETMEDLQETVQLLFYLRDLNCDVSISLLSPLPLSHLYESGEFDLLLRDGYQSSVVSSRFYLPDGSELVDGKPVELVSLIRQHPRIFPGFYTFADNLFEEKLAYLYSMGLEMEKLERQ